MCISASFLIMKSITMLFTESERMHSSLMLTSTLDQLFKLIVKNSIRPLWYFSWHITLYDIPQWIVVEVSKSNLRVYDWLSSPFHLMASLMLVQGFLKKKSGLLILQAETNFTFITFIYKVFCRFFSGKLRNIAPVFAIVFFGLYIHWLFLVPCFI